MLTFWFTVGGLLVGLGTGWWAKGKYGGKAQAEVTVAENLTKKL